MVGFDLLKILTLSQGGANFFAPGTLARDEKNTRSRLHHAPPRRDGRQITGLGPFQLAQPLPSGTPTPCVSTAATGSDAR